jgi:hypothetical protein
MSTFRIAAVAAAILGGSIAAAEAQPYGHYGYGHGRGYYGHQPQVWVPPNVARKQAQLQERFVEKYGVVQPPRPHWGHRGNWGHNPYAYRQPYHHVPHRYGW